MGKRGPARRPTNLALLNGEKPSRINFDAPIPQDGIPEPPYEMSHDVADVWAYTCGQLAQMGTLSLADRDTLAAYCEAVITNADLARAIVENPDPLIPGAMGGLVRNPLYAMKRDAATLLRTLAREFGLTPSARSDISVGGSNGGRPDAGPERFFS